MYIGGQSDIQDSGTISNLHAMHGLTASTNLTGHRFTSEPCTRKNLKCMPLGASWQDLILIALALPSLLWHNSYYWPNALNIILEICPNLSRSGFFFFIILLIDEWVFFSLLYIYYSLMLKKWQ